MQTECICFFLLYFLLIRIALKLKLWKNLHLQFFILQTLLSIAT